MLKNDKPTAIKNSVKAEITNSRMYRPFRALGKVISIEVNWDD